MPTKRLSTHAGSDRPRTFLRTEPSRPQANPCPNPSSVVRMSAYSQSAPVYDILCGHKDYAAAAARLGEIVRRIVPAARSLLDVACGTGLHLQYLRREFLVEGLDSSPEMLMIARQRCTDVPVHLGDFVDFR